jgi:ATP-binding protein involved in chromosome partitioning
LFCFRFAVSLDKIRCASGIKTNRDLFCIPFGLLYLCPRIKEHSCNYIHFHMTLYPKLITDALQTVRYPGTGKNLIESGMVEDDIHINGMYVTFTLIFDKPTDPFMKSIVRAAEAAIHAYVAKEVQVDIKTKSLQAPRPEVGKMLPGVKNIIAVSSGKGGVGKSTVAANLAIGLTQLGLRVGLLDADIFGPSMPKMFHVEEQRPYAEKVDGRDLIVPIEQYGLKLLSIGFFVSPEQATLWRGGMASNTLKQLIGDALWGDLDYMVIDTPPGTSDIHLTLVQTLALTGAVIVSTPQEVALADARKGINMYQNEKVNVPILGLVENMAWFTPKELPENRYYIFGKEGVKHLAEEMNVPLLAQIPLVQGICESGDNGRPAVLDADSMTGQAYRKLAAAVVRQTDKRNMQQPPTHIVEMN